MHTRETGPRLAFALSEREDTGGSDPRGARELPQRTAVILERIKFTHVTVPQHKPGPQQTLKKSGYLF